MASEAPSRRSRASPAYLGDMEPSSVPPDTLRTLVDLVEVDGKILTALAPTEADLRAKPELARMLAQRLYLLEKLERE